MCCLDIYNIIKSTIFTNKPINKFYIILQNQFFKLIIKLIIYEVISLKKVSHKKFKTINHPIFFIPMQNDMTVQVLNHKQSLKRMLGSFFLYGYSIGTLTGIILADKKNGLINSITKHNIYMGLTAVKIGCTYQLIKGIVKNIKRKCG